MSREWLNKTLQRLGFKQLDVEVYIYLLKSEPQKSKTIAEALKINENRLNRSLKSLQERGFVKTSKRCPVKFSAITFEEVIDQLIKADRDEAKQTEENREQILKLWRSKIIGQANSERERL